MKIKEIHLKIIAIGLLPIFIFLVFVMPDSFAKAVLLACIMITALVVSYIGRGMEKKEKNKDDDLLAIPPKKS